MFGVVADEEQKNFYDDVESTTLAQRLHVLGYDHDKILKRFAQAEILCEIGALKEKPSKTMLQLLSRRSDEEALILLQDLDIKKDSVMPAVDNKQMLDAEDRLKEFYSVKEV